MCKIKEFKHKEIAGYKISKNEEYLYLYDYQAGSEQEKKLRTLRVYSITTEKELREFSGLNEEKPESFGWSHDGKYLAKMSKDTLSIYETPEMHMLMDNTGKRTSIKADDIQVFSWNKTNNFLAMIKKPIDAGSRTSTVMVIDIPSREVVYLKSIPRLEKFNLVWHPCGHMLAIIAVYKKPGEAIMKSSIGILNIDKRRTEYIEEETTEVIQFKWEPTQENHFGILRLQKDMLVNKDETVMEVYSLFTVPLKIHRIPEASRPCSLSHLHWSPLGRLMVATRLIDPEHYLSGAIYGTQYFYYIKGVQAHAINAESHDNATGANWDPSGRYYASYVNSAARSEHDAYKIYNCFGETVYNEAVPKLMHVLSFLLNLIVDMEEKTPFSFAESRYRKNRKRNP